MSRGQIEAMIKERFIKVFKKNEGKGPKDSTIKIVKNFVIVEFTEVLTLAEKNLVKNNKDLDKLKILRQDLVEISKNDYISILEDSLSAKVIDTVFKVNLTDDVFYCMFILDENIEKKLAIDNSKEVG